MAKETNLLAILEFLQPKFISSKLSDREEAMREITEAMAKLPLNRLTEAETSVLIEFFCLRLNDNILLLPSALKGLLYLCCCQHFPEGYEKQIATALLKDQQIQSLKFEDRIAVFTIIGQLLSSRLTGLKSLGSEFVLSFVQAIDGEKDPRNLVIIFNLHLVVAKNFNLGPFADELFDVVSCYFPVDFKPPTSGNISVDGSTLAISLRNCLVACQLFSRPCLDLIMENLADDTKPATKTEAFSLLESALDAFSPESFLDYSVSLLNVIRKQALVPKTSAMETTALKCLEKLVSTVSSCSNSDVVGSNSALKVFLGQVIKDSEPFLCNPEMSLLSPSNNLLLSAAKASELACRFVASKVVPLLMEKCQGNREFAQESYSEALLAWLHLLYKQSSTTAESILSSVAESLSALLLSFIIHQNEKIKSVGFAGATLIKQMYPTGIAQNDSEKFLLASINNNTELSEAVDLMHIFAMRDWNLIESKFLDQMRAKATNEFGFQLLFALMVDANTYGIVVKSCFQSFNSESNKGDILIALRALLKIVKKFCVTKKLPSIWKHQCYPEMVQLLIRMCYLLLSRNDTSWMCRNDGMELVQMLEILKHVGLISQSVMIELGENVAHLIDWCVVTVLKGESLVNYLPSPGIFSENQSKKLLIVPITYLLAAGQSPFVQKYSEDLAKESMKIMLDSWTHSEKYLEEVRLLLDIHAARLLSNVVNKCRNDDPILIETIETFSRHVNEFVDSTKATEKQTVSVSQVMSVFAQMGYITKALLLRGWGPYDIKFLAQLISWLNQPTIAPAAVSSLEIILMESSDFLSTQLYVKETLLYKQRIFSHTIRLLLKEFQQSTNETKKYFFQTVKNLLMFAGYNSTLDTESSKLLPLLLQSVFSDDKPTIMASIVSIKALLKSPMILEFFKGHKNDFDSLIERLLLISTDLTSPLDLRAVVLECLQVIGKEFPSGLLFSVKKEVLKTLGSSLNDHKRVVRKAACLARNQWYLS